MKCSWDAERSFSAEACHLVMNSCGVMGVSSLAHQDDHLSCGTVAAGDSGRLWSFAIRCQNRGDGVRFRASHW